MNTQQQPKLEAYENFLEEDLLNDVVEYADKIYRSPLNQVTTNAYWKKDVVHDSTPVLVHHIPQHTEKNIWERICKAVERKTGITDVTDINVYFWTRLSYIPWHNDGHVHAAITVYLNKDWKPDYGGLFLYDYEHNGRIRGIIPIYNGALLQTQGLWHSTTPVNWSANVRITLQIFKRKKEYM